MRPHLIPQSLLRRVGSRQQLARLQVPGERFGRVLADQPPGILGESQPLDVPRVALEHHLWSAIDAIPHPDDMARRLRRRQQPAIPVKGHGRCPEFSEAKQLRAIAGAPNPNCRSADHGGQPFPRGIKGDRGNARGRVGESRHAPLLEPIPDAEGSLRIHDRQEFAARVKLKLGDVSGAMVQGHDGLMREVEQTSPFPMPKRFGTIQEDIDRLLGVSLFGVLVREFDARIAPRA